MKNIIPILFLCVTLASCSKKTIAPAKTLAQICSDSFPTKETISIQHDTVFKPSKPIISVKYDTITKDGKTVVLVKKDTIFQTEKVIDYITKTVNITKPDSAKIKTLQEVILVLEGRIIKSDEELSESKLKVLKLRGNMRTYLTIAISEFLILLLIALGAWYINKKMKKIF